jgi:hypothetical protein
MFRRGHVPAPVSQRVCSVSNSNLRGVHALSSRCKELRRILVSFNSHIDNERYSHFRCLNETSLRRRLPTDTTRIWWNRADLSAAVYLVSDRHPGRPDPPRAAHSFNQKPGCRAADLSNPGLERLRAITYGRLPGDLRRGRNVRSQIDCG